MSSLLLLLLLLLLLSILPLLLLFLAGVVVIVDDLVPGTKLGIIIIINDALDKLEKVDWHPLSILYFARQGTTVKVPRWSALN